MSQAFVNDPNNPGSFLPAGSRWVNKANYKEYDSYVQDNWRFRQNLVFDIGVRWEVKPPGALLGRDRLVPNQPVKLGAAPSNTLKWVPGDLFDTHLNQFLPSIGFAWDPFKSGKTSIRANYRLATDRFATFLFGSSIFQNAPGNTNGPTNSAFGQAGGLYRNLGPVIAALVPTVTPLTARQPAPFGTGTSNVIDPDLEYPQVHSFAFSVQREIGNGNVFEFNYIRKHAVHLLGGYNVNQANIFAGVSGITENFLDAFKAIKASTAYNSPLINYLFSGDATNNNGTARFRTLNATAISQGGAGSAALSVSQKVCVADDVAAGICTNAQLGQRLLDLRGLPFLLQPYPQFTGGFNVFDSNDFSNYTGLEFVFKRRISAGLGFQVAYTWSKSKDNRSFDPSLTTVSGGTNQSASSTPFDLRNRNLNYTYSDFDRRHVFQATYVYELPFGEGKWIRTGNGVVNYIIGGWQLSGTTIYQSGRPFTVYSGVNTLSSVVSSTADCSGCTRDMGRLVLESGRNFWFDQAARNMFSSPVAGTIGNTGRNFFLAPRYFQTDASLLRKFRFNERWSFDFRVDARNLINHPSFDNPTAVLTSTIFGRINDSVTNASRRIQLSGKLVF